MRSGKAKLRVFLASAVLPAFSAFPCLAAKMVIPNMADPSVVKGSDGNYYATGTNDNNDFIKIYRSPDMGTSTQFAESETYNPSGFGDAYRYCWNWAAEISYQGGKPKLVFSGVRVAKNAACPAPDNLGLFTADSDGVVNGKFHFGAPQPVSFPGVAGAPFSSLNTAACPAQGCDHALRIDGDFFTDPNTGHTWLNYVWFQDGCHTAGVDLADPSKVVRFADPTYSWAYGYRDVVAEGPGAFFRNGQYYLVFSHNRFDETYGTSYYRASSYGEFGTGSPRSSLTEAVVNRSGRILSNSGHGMVAAYGDKYYYIYHVGKFDANGKFTGRDTWLSPLAFDADGRIKNLTKVDIGWPEVPGAQYSLDIVTKSGAKIAPCVNAGIIDRDLGTVYEGYCPSAGDRLVDKSDIAKFQLCYAFNGDWAHATCTAKDFNGEDDTFNFGPSEQAPVRTVDMAVADAAPADYSPAVLEKFFDEGSGDLRKDVWSGLKEGSAGSSEANGALPG